MEMTILDFKKKPHGEKQIEAVGFTLVSELLGAVLADQDEKILIESRSQNFLYDKGTGLKTGKSLKTKIECGKVKKTEKEIEIRLSGTVENHLGQKNTCSLYFFMWWDHTTFSLSKKTYNFDNLIDAKSLLITLESNSEHLSDSIFKLDLYRESLSGHQQYLGHGRGYLVFGHKT